MVPTDPSIEPPTDPPTEAPSEDPTETPTIPPTEFPTEVPTETPTAPPTHTPAPVTPTPTPFPQEYISIAGRKIWDDQDDAKGLRPDTVTVRLTRNGTVIKELTVTADDGWYYRFDDLPVYDAQGKRYSYALSERPIIGYYASTDGYDLINRLIPDKPRPSDVPFPDDLTEDELTWELYLPNHSAPPYGGLLKTGLEIPAYPFVFAGIGCAALVAWHATKRKKRRK